MADVWPLRQGSQEYRIRDTDAQRHDGYPEDDDMDLAERINAIEKDVLRGAANQTKHEEVCALRYEIIKNGNERIDRSIKYLALSVAALALVVLGVATVNDLVRAGAARAGVTVQAAPAAPPATAH